MKFKTGLAGIILLIIGSGTIISDIDIYKNYIEENKIEFTENYEIDITTNNEDLQRGYFLENENGQTYGTYIIKEDGESIEPDLMLVEGRNKNKEVVGYAKREDIYDEENQPNNPEEAIEYTKEQRKKELNPFYEDKIPVYTHDGETIIGEFVRG